MAISHNEFWVHGIEVHVQNEPNPIATMEELRPRSSSAQTAATLYTNPRRTSQGTTIRQNEGSNWVHFALPSNPAYLDPEQTLLSNLVTHILLRGRSNGLAWREGLQVWSGGAPEATKVVDLTGRHLSLVRVRPTGGYDPGEDSDYSKEFDWEREVDQFEWRDPLVISFLLVFEPGGSITFGAAGVRFDWVED